MIAKPKVVAFVLLCSVLAWSTARAQRPPSPTAQDRDRERRSLAVNIVRAINTAEAHYKQAQGVYATWTTLTSNGDFTDSGTKWAPVSMPTVGHAMYGPGPENRPRLEAAPYGFQRWLRLRPPSRGCKRSKVWLCSDQRRPWDDPPRKSSRLSVVIQAAGGFG